MSDSQGFPNNVLDAKELKRLRRREDYLLNRDRYIKSAIEWAKNNKDRFLETNRRYRENVKLKSTPEQLALISKASSLRSKAWSLKNKERARKHRTDSARRVYNSNPAQRIKKNCRNRITSALRSQNCKNKAYKSIDLIGCTSVELKAYIEKKFKPGMSWDNKGEWHIDHIIPCASFDLTDHKQQMICFHYTNLQPLWAMENIKKGDSIINTINNV